jgi:hypothetical protein
MLVYKNWTSGEFAQVAADDAAGIADLEARGFVPYVPVAEPGSDWALPKPYQATLERWQIGNINNPKA